MANDNYAPKIAVDAGETGLKKTKMSTFTVVFMVFSLVAAGAYGIEAMIPATGPGIALILLMVLPFVWGLPFGLVASELGSVRPQEGGYYKWVQEALGEFWGFMAGWWRTISIYIDNTLYVILAGGYFASMVGFDKIKGTIGPWEISWLLEFAFKVIMILIFVGINLKGVKELSVVTNILSILVLVAFAVVAIIGFINWSGNPFTTGALPDEGIIAGSLTTYPVENPIEWIYYIGGGIAIGMWMYSGYESMSTIAGEIEDPQVIPKATLITVPLIMATYILPTMAGLAAFKGEGPDYSFLNWGEEAPAIGYATVAEHFTAPVVGIIFAIVAILAQCSIYNTYIASGSRGFFTLAGDKLAPPFLVKVNRKTGIPQRAVLSVGIVNIILCMFAFKTIVVVDVFLLISSYIMVYISAMILRKKFTPEEYKGKFKIPGGYGFLCVLCIVPIAIAVFSFFINGTDYFIGGMIGIISGPIVYFIWKRIYGGLNRVDPQQHKINKKTGLAPKDMKRLSVMFGLLTIIGLLGAVWLPFFEGGQNLLGINGVTMGEDFAWAFPDDYSMTLFGSQEAMWLAIKVATVIAAVLTVVFYITGKSVEKEENYK
ncbi:MAG: APC family permease [Clostridiales Family XIII bacterium]|jgi:amino acid transporter|nr:APC family permease [Clostridiales Family XIII bacterium]